MNDNDSEHREHLLADLQSGDEEVRRLAVERLTTLPGSEVVPALVGQLADPSWRVRKAAIERLAGLPESSSAIPSLVDALRDGDNPGRRNAALEALVRLGRSVLPALIEASHEEDVDVRKQIVDALSGIADPAAGARLRELLGDSDPNVRAAAVEGLGCLGDLDVVPQLMTLIAEDAEALVRLSCLRTLDRLEVAVATEPLTSVIDDPMLRCAAFSLLAHSDGEGVIDLLLKGMESGGPSSRDAAAQALVRLCARSSSASDAPLAQVQRGLGTEGAAYAYALERAASGPLAARLAVVQLLGLVADASAVPALLEAAGDEALTEVALASLHTMGESAVRPCTESWDALSTEARAVACRLLSQIETSEARAILSRALRGADFEVRAPAAEALGIHAAAEAVPDLVVLLERATDAEEPWRDTEERAAAIGALETIGRAHPDVVLEAISEDLRRRSEGFRLAAAELLVRVGRPEDATRLDLLTSDPSPAVRRAAVSGLAEVMSEPPLETLQLALADEDAGVRIGAAGALAAWGGASVLTDLAHLTTDGDERVRAAAVRALGRWCQNGGSDQRESVLVVVEEALGQGGSAAMAGLEVLRELGGADSVALAAGMLSGTDGGLVEAAIGCIGEHADVETLNELLPLLSHEQWVVRASAVDVFAARGMESTVPALLRRLESETDEFVRDAILGALDRLE